MGLLPTFMSLVSTGVHRQLSDGTQCLPTEILAIDKSRDLVLFRINRAELPALPLGNQLDLTGPDSSINGNPLGYGLV